MIAYCHEAVIRAKKNYAIIICSIVHAKSVKSKKMIRTLQVKKKMTMMPMKVWTKINLVYLIWQTHIFSIILQMFIKFNTFYTEKEEKYESYERKFV